VAPGADTTSEVTITPPPSQSLRWLLVVVGIAVVIYAALLRDNLRTTSVTVKNEPPTRTVVEKPPSDALLGALFAAGLVTILAGAFYSRVTKLAMWGNTVELGGVEDSDALGEAIAAKIVERQRAAGAPLDATAAEAVIRSATAAARAQSEALRLSAALSTSAWEPVPRPVGAPLPRELLERLIEHSLEEREDRSPPAS
jgi:hypothetical protein